MEKRLAEGLAAHVSITIDAPRAKVWDGLVNPVMIARYMSMTSVASELRDGNPIVWKSEWQGRSFARSSLHPEVPIRQRITIA